jgi:hypothetical protein
MPGVITWNGRNVPAELRSLAAGRYVLGERIEDPPRPAKVVKPKKKMGRPRKNKDDLKGRRITVRISARDRALIRAEAKRQHCTEGAVLRMVIRGRGAGE